MSSSRPEVHFQLSSAGTPSQQSQLALAMGLPGNSSFDSIIARAAAMYALIQGVAAGTSGQPEAQAFLGGGQLVVVGGGQ